MHSVADNSDDKIYLQKLVDFFCIEWKAIK